MRAEELISIVIPVYKVEKYLNKCVQSVVNQTYQNIEIILVDDGSPDLCPKICDDWEKKDSRIRVIHKKNGGLSDARNVGVRASKGQFIGFVDSDDYIEETMYEELYRAIKSANAEVAICDYEAITEEGIVLKSESPIKYEMFSKIEAEEKLIGAGQWYYVTAWNKLYSRYILEEIEFPVGKIHEDEFVVHEVFWKCNRIVSIDRKLYKYVQRAGSITSGANGIRSLDMVEAFCERLLFYREHELRECVSKFCSVLKNIYIRNRLQVFGIHPWNEYMRIRKVDKMFRKAYFSCKDSISLKERILYIFPIVLYFRYKIQANSMRTEE